MAHLVLILRWYINRHIHSFLLLDREDMRTRGLTGDGKNFDS